LIDFSVEKNDIRLRIKKIISQELQLEDEIDQFTRNTIASFSRRIPEGSKEWEIVYRRVFSEEMKKRRGVDS
jgi:hypothetical protein